MGELQTFDMSLRIREARNNKILIKLGNIGYYVSFWPALEDWEQSQ